jgi:hypothetical protein
MTAANAEEPRSVSLSACNKEESRSLSVAPQRVAVGLPSESRVSPRYRYLRDNCTSKNVPPIGAPRAPAASPPSPRYKHRNI